MSRTVAEQALVSSLRKGREDGHCEDRRRAHCLVAGAGCFLFILHHLVTTFSQSVSHTDCIDRGIVNSFGVYQNYYESSLLSTTSSSSQISWTGSIQAFLLLIIGVVTGPLFDQGYLDSMLLVGSFLTVFGIMMTSLCTKYWQIVLAQGVCVGLGAGCMFVPAIAVVSTFFTTKRAIATGIAVGGGSVGGIVYPIVFRAIQPRHGFGWATRTIGFITLALLCVANATMRKGSARTPSAGKPSRPLFQPSAFKSLAYTSQTLGVMVGFTGLYVPVFYIQSYALARGLTSDTNYVFYLLPILNAASFFGRIIPSFLADKIGPMNMITPCTFAAGILSLCWIGISTVTGLTVFAVLYGFFAGAYVSLITPVLVGLVPDMTVVGTWMGMSVFVAAFGLLVGNPIAGALVDIPKKQFAAAQGFAGGTVLLGALFMLVALVSRARRVKSWKV